MVPPGKHAPAEPAAAERFAVLAVVLAGILVLVGGVIGLRQLTDGPAATWHADRFHPGSAASGASGAPQAPPVSPNLPPPQSPRPSPRASRPTGPAQPTTTGKAVFYKNCTEAWEAAAAPLRRGQPGYRAELDPDGDGVACEHPS